jgi:hypothetical protein
VVKSLENNDPDKSLIIIKHKKSVIKDETVTYILKFFDKNYKIYDELYIKDFKMAIRTKKLADILS